jgi:DNA-binding transcriptional LysR family regulator
MTVAKWIDAPRVSIMEFRHLRAFLALAEERHFGRAAERMGISQPPLSRQIQQLETELGVRLFSRNSRSVSLTREGMAYLEAIRPHLDGLLKAAKAARLSSRTAEGKVRAGFVSHLAYAFVPRLMESLGKSRPGIGVEWTELPSPEQLRALRERRIDIGLVLLPVDDPGLTMRLLFRESIVAMLPSDHALAALDAVPVSALAEENFVLCPRYRLTGFHETILNLCRTAGFEPRVNHEASSKTMVTELVASRLGVSLVPESGALDSHPGVVYRPLSGPPSTVEIAAVWLAESMTPVLRAFIDHAVHAGAGSLGQMGRNSAASPPA